MPGLKGMDEPMPPTAHELWRQANGDREKYRELMIQHGLLIVHTDETKPEPHVFQGLTRACMCSVCHGPYKASWHIIELTEL